MEDDMETSISPLPATTSHVTLRLLDGGSFKADISKIHADVENYVFRMYDWAFHIFEPQSERHVLWDVGLSGNDADYTPWVVQNLLGPTEAVGPRISLQDQLRRHGVGAEQIDAVLFSHAHYDHCRPIGDVFPCATGYFGPGTTDFCHPSSHPQWEPRFFDPTRSTERFEALGGPWQRFGPFEKAMDFFGNGSFWVIQAPGHMPGNMCAAARLKSGEWVLLGSDCCHSRALLDGKHDLALFSLPDGSKMCLQADQPAARNTVRRIKLAEQKLGFHVALAHDADWMLTGSDETLIGLLDEQMKQASRERIPKGEVI